MPVLDASVLVEYLAGAEHAEAVDIRLRATSERLWAPQLIDAEVGHVLRRGVRLGELSARTARAAIDDLGELPLQRTGHVGLLERAWAIRRNVSFYDGIYVALAERLKLPLLTLDARLGRAPGNRARVEVIA